MTPDERLKEIERDLYIHNELARSQNEWLIERVKKLTDALKEYAENPIKEAGCHADHIERLINEGGCQLARRVLNEQ